MKISTSCSFVLLAICISYARSATISGNKDAPSGDSSQPAVVAAVPVAVVPSDAATVNGQPAVVVPVATAPAARPATPDPNCGYFCAAKKKLGGWFGRGKNTAQQAVQAVKPVPGAIGRWFGKTPAAAVPGQPAKPGVVAKVTDFVGKYNPFARRSTCGRRSSPLVVGGSQVTCNVDADGVDSCGVEGYYCRDKICCSMKPIAPNASPSASGISPVLAAQLIPAATTTVQPTALLLVAPAAAPATPQDSAPAAPAVIVVAATTPVPSPAAPVVLVAAPSDATHPSASAPVPVAQAVVVAAPPAASASAPSAVVVAAPTASGTAAAAPAVLVAAQPASGAPAAAPAVIVAQPPASAAAAPTPVVVAAPAAAAPAVAVETKKKDCDFMDFSC